MGALCRTVMEISFQGVSLEMRVIGSGLSSERQKSAGLWRSIGFSQRYSESLVLMMTLEFPVPSPEASRHSIPTH